MRDHNSRPTALSVCSGIGGLDVGVARALGTRIVGYIEREAFAQAALLARMEAEALDCAPIFCDLEQFDGAPFRGLVDVVFGGIPCQPYSFAGEQRRQEDERDLVDEFLRVVSEVEPAFAIVENVRGFLTGDGLGRLLGGLAELGFDAEWEAISASAIGAPHKRNRVFVLAHHNERRCGINRETLQARKHEPRGHDANRCGAPMADAECGATQRRGKPGDIPSAQDEPRDEIDRRDAGWRAPHASREDVGGDWPPGPDDDWSGVPRGLWPATKPEVRRMADGVPPGVDFAHRLRADRLRALGNAVVPKQAETAIRALLGRILE